MASPGDEGLPALPPIKTTTTTPLPPPAPPSATASTSASPAASSSAAVDSSAKAAEEEEGEDDHEPSTPTSEGSRLRPPAVCPPAPRKPPAPRLPLKRGKPPLPSPARVFVAVPRDLSTVFRALPPKKRVRVS